MLTNHNFTLKDHVKGHNFFRVFKKMAFVRKAIAKLKDRISWRKPTYLKEIHYSLVADHVCWFQEENLQPKNLVLYK